MRKIIVLLLVGVLVASLVMQSNLTLAEEDGDDDEDGEDDGETGNGGGTTGSPDDEHQYVGSPDDEKEDLPSGEQGSAPPEAGFTLSDEVKACAAAATVVGLVVAFVIWMKRGGTGP